MRLVRLHFCPAVSKLVAIDIEITNRTRAVVALKKEHV